MNRLSIHPILVVFTALAGAPTDRSVSIGADKQLYIESDSGKPR
jgi:hypothetical protein